MIAASERGLSIDAALKMTPGAIVDYVIAWNRRQEAAEKESERPHRRRATQADWDRLGGR